MRIAALFLPLAGLLTLSACDEPSKKITAGRGVGECHQSNDKLADTQWVMWESQPSQGNRKNPMARMKFYNEDGGLKVDYTVKSPYEVHTYKCAVTEKEVQCREEGHLKDWCQALEVHKVGSCTAQKLKEFGAVETDEEIATAVKEAVETVEKYRGGDAWQRFVMNNNTLANKLQGQIDVRIRKKRCQLMVTDNYMTIYNGKKMVDSNPVGTNAFVLDEEPWHYGNCTEGTRFLALADEKAPKTDEEIRAIQRGRKFAKTDTVYYHYIGIEAVEAAEGCTYSADTFAQWLPEKQNLEMKVEKCDLYVEEDGKKRPLKNCVIWGGSHVWADDYERLKFVAENDAMPRAIFGMDRYKTCSGGEREKIDTICAAASVSDL